MAAVRRATPGGIATAAAATQTTAYAAWADGYENPSECVTGSGGLGRATSCLAQWTAQIVSGQATSRLRAGHGARRSTPIATATRTTTQITTWSPRWVTSLATLSSSGELIPR